MNPYILAIGKAIPPYHLSQEEIANRLIEVSQLTDEEAWLLKKIYTNSSVSRRYSVLPDIVHPKSSLFSESSIATVGMTERNALYKREAPLLAERAALETIKNWQGKLKDITHIISVSCTGAITPGVEFILSRKLGLKDDVSLLGVNFMGCYGAFKGLKVASKIAKESPKNRVLIVCTELCTLHFKTLNDIETLVIQSLFADGSAGVIVGTEPRENENTVFEIVDEKSSIIEGTEEDMTWDASSLGFDMTLSARVPKLINENIEQFVRNFLGFSYKSKKYNWAIHPGGKAIVEAVEEGLKLDKSQTTSSWNVLKSYGNLSSATFLYVLEDIYRNSSSNERIVGLGFGPGLCIEALLLK